MRSQETQTTTAENNQRLIDNKLNSKNEQKDSNSEPIERVDAERFLPSQETALNPLVRNALIVSILALLFVAGIYYGVINP